MNILESEKENWEKFVQNNQDPYGSACVNVSKRVMELLDEHEGELEEGYYPNLNTPHGLICKADDDIKAGGITGYMAGVVASAVSNFHPRGEEFRKIWNSKHNHEGEGVVNPAILNID